ncbi:BTB/POZ and MATH domain-containing protein 2-like [Panicum hallii]|jgi:speckle-type POZ protein|uniref:BTB/POZ and MATH domain-containing protein 2-like n=1 Tax=Panicum hallii TaxID=206008 RepID=UPI000DF4E951|nr:BTB/POZ and MATH domain-containing protein 2-like [Panicum hallii]
MPNLTEVARSKDLLLKVEGHSVTTAMGDGEFIKSSRWIVGGHFWEIHLRPKDHWAGRHRPVTLKLVLRSEPRGGDVKAKLSCRLVDPAGRLGPSEEKSVAHKFQRPGDYSSPAVLTAREDLEASGYLADDAYTVQCAIAVLREVPPQTATAADDPRREAAVPSPDLLRHLRELLREGTGADVTFLVSGQPFAAHRAVLAARSPVFMAQLFGGMREGSSSRRVEIEVKDIEPAVFGALLGFVYTDTVPELDRLEGEEEAASMAQHLLAGADRYGLDRLKLICEWKLSDGITVDTAATTLVLAEQHRCWRLKARCVEFVAGYLDAVLETEGYRHLEESCPAVLTDLLKAARGVEGPTS